jgi:hypothetical protein
MRGRDTWPDHRRRRPRGRDGRFVTPSTDTVTLVARGGARSETVPAPPETAAHDDPATPHEQHDHRRM